MRRAHKSVGSAFFYGSINFLLDTADMYSIFHVRFDSRSYTFLVLIACFSTIYSSTVYAGAAEQWNASPRQMTIADMGMRTRNGIGIENVKAANGMINADITQRVTVDGSNATINTKVAIPQPMMIHSNVIQLSMPKTY